MINNPVVMDITVSGSNPVLQSKSISPSESTQTVTPDTGYDGLSSVSVGAIQTETKTVTSNGTVTPSSGKYLKQVTVNVPMSGLDTSDATATADDIAQGKTAYINGGKVNGALLDYLSDEKATFAANYTQVSDHNDSKFLCRGTNLGDKILRDGAYANVYVWKNVFGDATAEDVAEGKTFTSSAGLKVTGTHVCSGGGTTPTLQSKTVSPSTSQQIITPDSGYNSLSRVTVDGDANLVAENIKSGVSIFGVAGNFEGSSGSGGSSDNNCEAYHITSASDVLSFKGTGTVKVWGYGTATSGYSTSVYAFVGDGYYKSASWGNPTKTSASFSVNADGTLSGLPSDLTAVDLLVTIGV